MEAINRIDEYRTVACEDNLGLWQKLDELTVLPGRARFLLDEFLMSEDAMDPRSLAQGEMFVQTLKIIAQNDEPTSFGIVYRQVCRENEESDLVDNSEYYLNLVYLTLRSR